MAANHKLTQLLKGRAITGSVAAEGKATVSFDDGSQMVVRLAGQEQPAGLCGIVKSVRQSGAALSIDLESGETLALGCREPTSSVMVRDRNHTMEYVD